MVSPVWVLRKDRDFSGSGRGAAEADARAAGKATASAESAAVFKNPRRQMVRLDESGAAAVRLVKRFSSQDTGFRDYPISLPETPPVLKMPPASLVKRLLLRTAEIGPDNLRAICGY